MTKQVGGDHYATASGTQHWDLFGPEYLMGYATKYMRWRKKGGVEDLRKAMSIVGKLLAWVRDNEPLARPEFRHVAGVDAVQAWCREYGLDFVETLVVTKITHWRDARDLEDAIAGLDYLIANNETKTMDPNVPEGSSWPVDGDAHRPATPDDGGQHASLFPWYLTSDYVRDQIAVERWTLLMPFYRVLGTDKNRVLEPVVESRVMPRELSGIYQLIGDSTYVIRVGDVPESVRDYFPNLRRELNAMEHPPAWQRWMYDWHSGENKFVLADKYRAWVVE